MSIPPLPKGLPDSERHRAANALHSLAIHLLRRARRADRKTLLGPERLSLLSVLAFAGPRTIGGLAEIEGVSPPAISRIVSALEAAGLAARRRASGDARAVEVLATPAGRDLVEVGRRRRIELIADEFAALSARDLAALSKAAGVLERLEREARSARSGPKARPPRSRAADGDLAAVPPIPSRTRRSSRGTTRSKAISRRP